MLWRSMTEPLRNYGDHGGATAVYVVQAPQWHRAFGVTGALRRSRAGSTEVKCVTARGKLLKTTGGVTTVMAVLIKNRSVTAPPV